MKCVRISPPYNRRCGWLSCIDNRKIHRHRRWSRASAWSTWTMRPHRRNHSKSWKSWNVFMERTIVPWTHDSGERERGWINDTRIKLGDRKRWRGSRVKTRSWDLAVSYVRWQRKINRTWTLIDTTTWRIFCCNKLCTSVPSRTVIGFIHVQGLQWESP